MAKWLIELAGDLFYLEDLPHFFPSGDPCIVREDSSFFLQSSQLAPALPPRSIYDRANELIERVTYVLSLHLGHFERPRVNAVVWEADNGSRSNHYFLQGSPGVTRSKLRVSGRASQTPTPAQSLYAAALVAARSEHLHNALMLWSDQVMTWPRLYRLVEEVQQHLKAPLDKVGFCSSAQLVRFTRTANSAEAAGLDARHASKRFDVPPNPMSIDEAAQFARSILLQLLQTMPPNEPAA